MTFDMTYIMTRRPFVESFDADVGQVPRHRVFPYSCVPLNDHTRGQQSVIRRQRQPHETFPLDVQPVVHAFLEVVAVRPSSFALRPTFPPVLSEHAVTDVVRVEVAVLAQFAWNDHVIRGQRIRQLD